MESMSTSSAAVVLTPAQQALLAELKQKMHVNLKPEAFLAICEEIENPDYKSIQNALLNSDIRKLELDRSLPDVTQRAQNAVVRGNFFVQVLRVSNIAVPSRMAEQDGNNNRTLFVQLTDGNEKISGVEYSTLKKLSVDTPPGTKLILTELHFRNGMILLEDSHFTFLGGSVDTLIQSWLVNKQISAGRLAKKQVEGEDQPPAFEPFTISKSVVHVESTSLSKDDDRVRGKESKVEKSRDKQGQKKSKQLQHSTTSSKPPADNRSLGSGVSNTGKVVSPMELKPNDGASSYRPRPQTAYVPKATPVSAPLVARDADHVPGKESKVQKSRDKQGQKKSKQLQHSTTSSKPLADNRPHEQTSTFGERHHKKQNIERPSSARELGSGVSDTGKVVSPMELKPGDGASSYRPRPQTAYVPKATSVSAPLVAATLQSIDVSKITPFVPKQSLNSIRSVQSFAPKVPTSEVDKLAGQLLKAALSNASRSHKPSRAPSGPSVSGAAVSAPVTPEECHDRVDPCFEDIEDVSSQDAIRGRGRGRGRGGRGRRARGSDRQGLLV